MINTIPAMAPTRTRALVPVLADTFGYGVAPVDAQLSWSLLSVDCVEAPMSRHSSMTEFAPVVTVRPIALAGPAGVPALGTAAAGAAAGNDDNSTTGRKQGRPPRGEPR